MQPDLIPTTEEHIDLAAIQAAYRWTVVYFHPRWGAQTKEGFARTEQGARGAVAEAQAEVAQLWADHEAAEAAKAEKAA
jgi:hypothetical protein